MAFLSARPIDIDYLVRRNWWRKVDVGEPSECWNWLQSTGSHGYGQSWDGVTVRLAHRVAWTLHYRRQIPANMTIDHECRNRKCCNPHHMRVMSNKDNAADNGQGRKTHCPRGHPYDGDNLRIDKRGARKCVQCQKDSNAGRQKNPR